MNYTLHVDGQHAVSGESQALRPGQLVQLSLISGAAPSIEFQFTFFKVGDRQTNWSFSTTAVAKQVGGSWKIEAAIGDIEDGAYRLFVSPASQVQYIGGPVPTIASIPIFVKADGPFPSSVEEEISRQESLQFAYVRKVFRAEDYDGDKSFFVQVLLEGCRLDHDQPIEGGFLSRVPFGIGPQSQVAAVARLWPALRVEADEELRQIFEAGNPLALVSFHSVNAPDQDLAFSAIRSRLNTLIDVLALDRDAPARVVAISVSEQNSLGSYVTLVPKSYPGNLLSGFFSGAVTDSLDDFVRAAEIEPWISLIISMYTDAVAERNPLFRVVKLWAALEACAKRCRASASQPWPREFSFEGESASGDLGAVCRYIIDETAQAAPLGDGTSRMAILKKLYLVRNIGAHEGVINRPSLTPERQEAVQYVLGGGGWRELREMVSRCFYHEKIRVLGG